MSSLQPAPRPVKEPASRNRLAQQGNARHGIERPGGCNPQATVCDAHDVKPKDILVIVT